MILLSKIQDDSHRKLKVNFRKERTFRKQKTYPI